MVDEDAAPTRQATLLQVLLWRRNLTREETVEFLAARADAMGERTFSLTLRQLDRYLAGEVATAPRASVRRLLEAEFGFPTELLLGPAARVSADLDGSRRAGAATRTLGSADFVAFLAERSGASFEETYAFVAEAAEGLAARPSATTAADEHARAALSRATLAAALQRYYASPAATFYTADVAGSEGALSLSVVAEASSIGLSIELGGPRERTVLSQEEDVLATKITPTRYWAAVKRLAAIEAGETVLSENPLYRLLDLGLDDGALSATFGRTSFSAYALSADLLAGELIDALVADPAGSAQLELPLRDDYLPSVAAARNYRSRICAGGPVCLLAIARADDYLLIVQERSPRVLNATGRLAVVPKAFHQPLAGDDHALSATLERELEEELFGREELDQLSTDARRLLAPGHASMTSAPMRWLREHPEAYLLCCTAVGINMVSGNYEVACLIVIDDPSWWDRYGGVLRANWEVGRIHRFSSCDADGLAGLLADRRWSDEGLFAFIEGLRLLAEHAPARVRLPRMEVRL